MPYPLADEIAIEVGTEIASVLTLDKTDNFLIIRVTVPLVPFDLQKLDAAVKRRGGEYVNEKKDGKDAGFFRVPLAQPTAKPVLPEPSETPPQPQAVTPPKPDRPSPLHQFLIENKCAGDATTPACEDYGLCQHPNSRGKVMGCMKITRFNQQRTTQAQQPRPEPPKPVQQPQAQQSSRTPAEDLSSIIRNELPIIEPLLQFEIKGNYLKIKPKQFLGDEAFRQTLDIVTKHGGKYNSAGKDSHFTVPIPMPRAAQEQKK